MIKWHYEHATVYSFYRVKQNFKAKVNHNLISTVSVKLKAAYHQHH